MEWWGWGASPVLVDSPEISGMMRGKTISEMSAVDLCLRGLMNSETISQSPQGQGSACVGHGRIGHRGLSSRVKAPRFPASLWDEGGLPTRMAISFFLSAMPGTNKGTTPATSVLECG